MPDKVIEATAERVRDCERCGRCGREQRLAWSVDTDLWKRVGLNPDGDLLCLECFFQYCLKTGTRFNFSRFRFFALPFEVVNDGDILARLDASEKRLAHVEKETERICIERDALAKENADLRAKILTLRALLNHSVIRSEIHNYHMCGVCPECHMIYKLHTSTIHETPELPPVKDGEESFPQEMLDEHLSLMVANHVAPIRAQLDQAVGLLSKAINLDHMSGKERVDLFREVDEYFAALNQTAEGENE